MSTPPELLIERLRLAPCASLIDLRTDDKLEDRITVERAVTMARRGLIEGVGPRSGRIQYVRRLRESAMPPRGQESQEHGTHASVYQSSASVVARTNLGTFRQRLNEAIVADSNGHRAVVGEGEMMGFCWTFCGAGR